jgi:putative transposase
MSRPGNYWDNAVVESVFATLKTELRMTEEWNATRQAARTAIFAYVEGFYNRARRHSTLGYLSPVELEQRATSSPSGVH